MARLVLVDTSDQLPGLLPLHAWSALMTSDLVLVRGAAHPFVAHLQAADLRYEVLPTGDDGAARTRAELLAGLTGEQKRQASFVVDRTREAGEVAYLFGPADSEAFTRTVGMEAARAGVEVEVVYFGVAPKGSTLLELVGVEARLRGPDGCPWDREQDHASLGRYAIEEVYELAEAIASGEPDAIREELGDVLLQVIFHAQIAEDAGNFDIDAVARGIVDKLVRRHPHVFADAEVADAGDVMANWQQLKSAEKPERTGVFDGVSPAQPALQYMDALLARTGWQLDCDTPDGAMQSVRDALAGFTAAPDPDRRARKLGDVLASVVNLGRAEGIDLEAALRGSAGRFRARAEHVAVAADRPLADLPGDERRRLWQAAKKAVG